MGTHRSKGSLRVVLRQSRTKGGEDSKLFAEPLLEIDARHVCNGNEQKRAWLTSSYHVQQRTLAKSNYHAVITPLTISPLRTHQPKRSRPKKGKRKKKKKEKPPADSYINTTISPLSFFLNLNLFPTSLSSSSFSSPVFIPRSR